MKKLRPTFSTGSRIKKFKSVNVSPIRFQQFESKMDEYALPSIFNSKLKEQ